MIVVYNVKDYGAIGDGKILNTEFIQAAIDDCAKNGGGKVILENGVYLSGSIELRSFVEFHIAGNAMLLGSPDCNDFPERENVKHVDTKMLARARDACLIFADECKSITLTGQGVIDCNGDKFIVLKEQCVKGWKYKRIDAHTAESSVFHGVVKM